MIVDGEKRHYNAIKSISRLLSSLNGKTKRAYHYCMNCLNGFRTALARGKHYEYCSSNSHVKVNMPAEEESWLKFHDGQYQFILHLFCMQTLKVLQNQSMSGIVRR